jgi:hypothetical protein
MSVEIGPGLRDIWVVWRDEHPPDGGNPVFLAAYDGPNAKESAFALVEMLKRAGAYGQIRPSSVPLWPLLPSAEAAA